jgi:hypothetical protein
LVIDGNLNPTMLGEVSNGQAILTLDGDRFLDDERRHTRCLSRLEYL